jgi:protein TonB
MRWRNPSILVIAVVVSVAVHATLLVVRFAESGGFTRLFEESPLEVILVNSRSAAAPDQAQAIAQANLAGGGESESGRAASPLPPTPDAQPGDAAEDMNRQLEQLQETQSQLLAEVRRELATLPVPDRSREEGKPESREEEERRKQRIDVLGSIEKRIQDENQRPKRRFISAATREATYAVYYDGVRRKVEERGTRNFPENQGQKLYGELTMILTLDSAGRVVETEIVRPSGSALLDRRAVAIVQAASPFGTFPDAMRRQADQLVITSRFRFSREEGLEATLGTAP